ncbi:hypothetical protein [Actinomadura parmotrematis]|uniref:CARDB domain-containing protein n=1 Tax=Actinomadura parmotrematis TaxID=2864039 RepID=A0ABS7FTW6_9ACTN|nr:hypothetical protein [Actinomadura parmotrematis]MBW8483854.1 hypothetical protein [Actinomadura parmotrematis]
MQLPRVVIAAVFFVIGVLIAVPPLIDWTTKSKAESPLAQRTSPTPADSGSGASPTPHSPTPRRTVTASGSASATTSPTRTTKPPTTRPPVQPLSVTIASATCPGRTVEVTVRNAGSQSESYGITRDDNSPTIPGLLLPRASHTTRLTLREDRRTRIQVTWKNEPVYARSLTANCAKASAVPTHKKSRKPSPTPTALPHTGPDNAVLWARGATGAAAMVTGLIIFWYGGIWPRRRDQVFARKDSN